MIFFFFLIIISLQWCLYVCERAIIELLGNADMLSPVMNIIRWMPVVTLRPDTHTNTQVYRSMMWCIRTYTGTYTHGMMLLRHTNMKALTTDISCLCLKRLFALRQCLCLLTLNYSASPSGGNNLCQNCSESKYGLNYIVI